MSDNNIKDLRKQIKNVVQQALPAVLTEELTKAIYTGLKNHLDEQLKIIAANIKESLDAIDQRSKDVQSYVIRNSAPKI